MSKPRNYLKSEASFDLPASLTREIGRIIVRWAYLEFKLQQVIWNLLQVTFPFGRIAAREPRLEDRVTMIKQLSELRGIDLPDETVTNLQSEIKEVRPDRDLLAHGFWFPHSKGWIVGLTRGKWPDNEPHPNSKSVVPEALLVTVDALRQISRRIEKIVSLADVVAREVQKTLQPPPEVHPEQLPRKIRTKNRNPSKSEPRQKRPLG